MRTMRISPLLATLAIASGVGSAAALPLDPAPPSGPAGFGPPPAWIESEGGDRWLAPSWNRWCEEAGESRATAGLPPGQRVCSVITASQQFPLPYCQSFIPRLPEIRLRPGEIVRFHLGFAPTALALAVRAGTFALPAAETAEWTVQGGTGGAILAPSTDRGDPTYRGRFVITSDAAPPRLGRLRLGREGARASLAFHLSEPATLVGCLARVGRAPRIGGPIPFPTGRRTVPAGERRAPLGAPAGRYRLTLLARDRGGNSTLVEPTLSLAR